MPFDGNPAKFVKPEVFSLPGLIAWLETQDPATEYDYTDPDDCILARAGWPEQMRFPKKFSPLYRVAAGPRLINDPAIWTYGAALSRARQLLATA